MADWKKQLAEMYGKLSEQQRNTKGSKGRGDTITNFKGKLGYNDAGIPISEKTRREKELNRKRYAGRKGQYHFSHLKRINDAAAELGRKYRYKNPEHVKIVTEAVELAKDKIEDQKKEKTKAFADAARSKRNLDYRVNTFAPVVRKQHYNYYEVGTIDDGSVEVEPTPIEKEVKYKNKIWEEVARLKKKYY